MFNTFLNETYILVVSIQWENVKSDLIFKNKSIFTFNDTGLDTHLYDLIKKLIIIHHNLIKGENLNLGESITDKGEE